MGRVVKRVPLDFVYPIGKVWKGYINPHEINCPKDCEGGYSKAYKILEKALYRYSLTKEEREEEMVALLLPKLSDGMKSGDGVSLYRSLTNLGIKEGLSSDWHICSFCDGNGIHPDHVEDYENWQKEEPPTGEGYQLWGTTSLGDPKSPVFKTLHELAAWCEEHATVFGSIKASKEEWEKMFSDHPIYHRIGNKLFI